MFRADYHVRRSAIRRSFVFVMASSLLLSACSTVETRTEPETILVGGATGRHSSSQRFAALRFHSEYSASGRKLPSAPDHA